MERRETPSIVNLQKFPLKPPLIYTILPGKKKKKKKRGNFD